MSSSVFISGRMPPMATSSDIKCFPLGFKSASTGTRLPMRVKSSSDSFTFAAWAMASRCSTALVEPPSAMTTVMAFSKAFFVRMSSGRDAALAACPRTAAPARRQSSILAGEMAFCAELLGRLMPSASMALAMVLAVYMPPQEPGPGMAHCLDRLEFARRKFSGWRARRWLRTRRRCPACACRR